MSKFLNSWLLGRMNAAAGGGGGGGGILPAEYQQVTYLQGNGSAYIDLGVNNKTTFGLRADAQPLSPYEGNAIFTAGALAGNNHGIGCRIGYWGINYNPYPANDVSAPNTTYPVSDRYNRRVVQVNYYGSGYGIVEGQADSRLELPSSVFQNTNYTFLLFVAHSYGGSLYGTGYSRLFHFELTDGQDLVMDLYPCYRKSDNKPGLYDLVTEQFLTNANTSGNDFTVGSNV